MFVCPTRSVVIDFDEWVVSSWFVSSWTTIFLKKAGKQCFPLSNLVRNAVAQTFHVCSYLSCFRLELSCSKSRFTFHRNTKRVTIFIQFEFKLIRVIYLFSFYPISFAIVSHAFSMAWLISRYSP